MRDNSFEIVKCRQILIRIIFLKTLHCVNVMIYVAFWLLQGWKLKSLQCVKVNWNNYLFVSRDLHPFVNLLPQFSWTASAVGRVVFRPGIVNCFCALDLKLNLIFILLLRRNTWQWH